MGRRTSLLQLVMVSSIACSSDSSPAPSGQGQGADPDEVSLGLDDELDDAQAQAEAERDAPSCLAQVTQAEKIGLDIFVMLDSSESMLAPLPGQDRLLFGATKWDAIRFSLESFVTAPETADIGVGLQFFPQEQENVPATCEASADCGPAGPCSSQICVDVEGGFAGVNADEATFCNVDEDCPGGQLCLLAPGACVLPPGVSAEAPEGGIPVIDDLLPVCGLQNHCSGLAGTQCERFGECSDGSGGCTTSLTCLSGADCLPIEFVCTERTLCEAADYQAPVVPIELDANQSTRIVEALNSRVPSGLTPTGPALAGALEASSVWAAEHPGRQVVTVLATDGVATQCSPTDNGGIAEIAAQGFDRDPGVRTFVVGVFSQADLNAGGRAQLDTIASAGGTTESILIDTSGDVAQQFLDALNEIRDSAASCIFSLDSTAALDFDRVNLTVTARDGSSVPLSSVSAPLDCGGADGWYYDLNEAGSPRQISVCPATCERIQREEATAQLEIGCETRLR